MVQPAPSPRFSRTVPALDLPPSYAGQHSDEVLESFGFGTDEIEKLRDSKAVV
jgi:alpha-methylacyl-CoA racemase